MEARQAAPSLVCEANRGFTFYVSYTTHTRCTRSIVLWAGLYVGVLEICLYPGCFLIVYPWAYHQTLYISSALKWGYCEEPTLTQIACLLNVDNICQELCKYEALFLPFFHFPQEYSLRLWKDIFFSSGHSNFNGLFLRSFPIFSLDFLSSPFYIFLLRKFS